MQSRNKREGSYLGKWDGYHMRTTRPEAKDWPVSSERLEPCNRKQRKFAQMVDKCYAEDFNDFED